MMFFVTERRLQAILDRDRVGQRIVAERETMKKIFAEQHRRA